MNAAIRIVSLLIPLLLADGTASVHGIMPRGAHLEFRLQGSPDLKTAEPGPGGRYNLDLPAGRYSIALVRISGKRSESYAWLANQVTLNVEVISGQENIAPAGDQYDLMADWRIRQSGSEAGVPARVTLEAELTDGQFEKLAAWTAVSVEDETEKEVNGTFNAAPDGRVLFRVRESHLRPERVVAMRVTAEAPGYAPTQIRVPPVLEFSASGHLHAVYPEQEFVIQLKPAVR